MATSPSAFLTVSKMPTPVALQGRGTRVIPVHGLARFAFWTILLFSLTNVVGVIVGVMRRLHDAQYELSIYPIVFAICTAIVLAFTRGRKRSTLLIVAFGFWLIYFLGGFLGVNQITATNISHTLRLTLKPWMAIVGLPFLALRTISEDKVARLIHVTVVVTCLGAVVGLLQIIWSGFMEGLIANVGRAEGVWSNPATSGYVCSMVLFLSLAYPFRSHLVNWASRLILLAGVATSLSRGPLVALLIAWVVYAVSARRFGTLIKSAIALVAFLFITLSVIAATESVSKNHEQRLASVRALLSGEWDAETLSNRTELWGPALDAILSKGGLVFGLGHGSMLSIVDTSVGGLQPHNYFLYVLGNSGIVALLALLVFHFALYHQALKVPDRVARAALFAIATIWALGNMVDDSLIGHPSTGAIFACMVVAVAYARPQQLVRRQGMRRVYNGSLPPRAR
jgi:hypothetical protein